MKENPIIDNNLGDSNANGVKNIPGTDSGTVTNVVTTIKSGGSEKVNTTNELDRLPEYPGSIKEFYKYVANNIEKSELDESGTSISVLMSFVIERDGSLSDIKVVRSSDKNLEKEAIRVLKASKVRWTPGFKDGEKVRTLYVLPIKVALN